MITCPESVPGWRKNHVQKTLSRFLGERYGAQRLENAAHRGLSSGAIRYKNIESILRNGLDNQPLPSSAHEAKAELSRPHHNNVRGSTYYH